LSTFLFLYIFSLRDQIIHLIAALFFNILDMDAPKMINMDDPN
jgi:hypothetical protein